MVSSVTSCLKVFATAFAKITGKNRIASRKICVCPLHKIIRLEVFSTSLTRSPPRSCSFAKSMEVVIMRSQRQIFHEAIGSIAVALAERFRIRPFLGRRKWVKE